MHDCLHLSLDCFVVIYFVHTAVSSYYPVYPHMHEGITNEGNIHEKYNYEGNNKFRLQNSTYATDRGAVRNA